jgi:hypothetical protein
MRLIIYLIIFFALIGLGFILGKTIQKSDDDKDNKDDNTQQDSENQNNQ